MQELGVSVGEWTDNQYANFGSSQDRLIMSGISGFLPRFTTSFRDNREYGNSREIRNRRDTAKILLDRGFTLDEISRLWSNYKLDLQSTFDKDKFLAYADRKRIIDKARKEEDDRLYEKGKAEEKKEIMSDLNLFPPKENNSPIPNELIRDEPKETEKTNYLVYGLIGLGLIVGAFLIFKKK
tara:strand:+ start:512 stop:1057 length:546 start_codon:yes stop_codon:yes gene_type:complete